MVSFKVLDLTGEEGFLCGKILADLGADVVKMEKPGGDPSRTSGSPEPDSCNRSGGEKSLYWSFYNSNKRGVTLNIEASDGKDIFRELIKKFDVVIESFPPGYLDNLGLGFSELSRINPGLIMTSITPFGHDGPCKDYKASDLTLMGLSGSLYMMGDPDRPPVRISVPQAYLHAGAEAATATMIAYYHREATGTGQFVDVSVQHSLIIIAANAIPVWEYTQTKLKRRGVFLSRWGGGDQRIHWRCKDGFVVFIVLGGVRGGRMMRKLTGWMREENMSDEFLDSTDWESLDMKKVTPEQLAHIEKAIQRFFLTHTKEEIYQAAIERRIILAPVSSLGELLESRQLEARGFWTKVTRPESESDMVFPGNFLISADGSRVPVHGAPLVGEHNQEIFRDELGISSDRLIRLKEHGVI